MYILKPLSKDPGALIHVKKRLSPEIIEKLLCGLVYMYIDLTMPIMNLSSTLNLKRELVSMGLSMFDQNKSNFGLLSERFNHSSDNAADFDVPSSAYMKLLHGVKLDEDAPKLGLDELRRKLSFGRKIMNPGIFSSHFLHKVNVEFTETETIASSATVMLNQGSDNESDLSGLPNKRKRFLYGGDNLHWTEYGVMDVTINQPFLFFIMHDPTNLTLFWGTVNDPTSN